MKPVLVGATLPQFTDDPGLFKEGARRAEACGLDSIWVFDHLWPLSGSKARPILEGWTSLAWLAEATEAISIGTLVTRSSLRNPLQLAQMARTVAGIAGPRLILGIGSGDNESRAENEAFGIPYWSGAERIAQFGAALAVLTEELRGHGVRLWVAGRSDESLALAARYGDAWNGWGGSPEGFERDAARVADYAEGREIELTWGGVMKTTDPSELGSTLRAYRRAGAGHLVCTFPEAGRVGVYESLATAAARLD